MRIDKRPQPRWWQHLKAIAGCYFWLPCPICGEYFGGHEVQGSWYMGNGNGLMVCANCVEQAKEFSINYYDKVTLARETMSHYWDFEGAESMDEHPYD